MLLSGWGRTPRSVAKVVSVTPEDAPGQITATMQAPTRGRGVIGRGLGRSYGDAAQLGGGTVVDGTGMDHISEIDIDRATLRAGAGVSLEKLMRIGLPHGLFVPVTPGTRQVTLGGAVAADIHGKNHHIDGSFGMHVRSLDLVTPTGQFTVGPEADPELFWATVGGMGLTGVVVDTTISMRRVETSRIRMDTERARDLDDVLEKMESRDDDYRYSVAWIDCVAKGRSLGRSVLTRGDHATVAELGRKDRRDPLAFDPSVRLTAPPIAPSHLLNRWSVAAFNEAWFRKAPRHETGKIVSLGSFFHPLDGVAGWNTLYGTRGFLQYQFVVPFGEEKTLRSAIEQLSMSGQASFLAVLKRFGHASPGPLSFPAPGWTLALDLPVGDPALGPMLDGLDELITAAGGRIYLAKDSRLRPDLVGIQYPRLGEWQKVRDRVDPHGVMCSDLCRRLDLAGHEGRPHLPRETHTP